jgi:hypothetical protein
MHMHLNSGAQPACSQNHLKPPEWKREVRPKEAAAMIGCSVGYVYSLMKENQLTSRALVRRGYERGIRLISVESINKFLEPDAATTKTSPREIQAG